VFLSEVREMLILHPWLGRGLDFADSVLHGPYEFSEEDLSVDRVWIQGPHLRASATAVPSPSLARDPWRSGDGTTAFNLVVYTENFSAASWVTDFQPIHSPTGGPSESNASAWAVPQLSRVFFPCISKAAR
jgi:hypothetical protein